METIRKRWKRSSFQGSPNFPLFDPWPTHLAWMPESARGWEKKSGKSVTDGTSRITRFSFSRVLRTSFWALERNVWSARLTIRSYQQSNRRPSLHVSVLETFLLASWPQAAPALGPSKKKAFRSSCIEWAIGTCHFQLQLKQISESIR